MITPIEYLGIGAAAAAVGGGAFAWATVAPRSRLWGPVIARGDVSDPPRYALTFDDGPAPGTTEKVLEILHDLNVKAAFFVIGRNAQEWPDLLKKIHDAGHVVANHSFDHAHFGGLGPRSYWRDQLRRTDEIISQIIGQTPALFRPPLGIKTWRLMSAARRTGHSVITWTRRGLDGLYPNRERILRRLAPLTSAGDILTLHDGADPHVRRDQSPTIAAIKPLIQQLTDRGLQSARLDELIRLPAYR